MPTSSLPRITKSAARAFIGKRVVLSWRDPTDHSEWTDKPLAVETQKAMTFGVPQGFNARGEFIIASSVDGEDQVGGLIVMPLACIEAIRELELKS